MTFVTGNFANKKRWVKVGCTNKTATFCELKWSEDLVGEAGVMYLTDRLVQVRLNKDGYYYKKPFGLFQKDESTAIKIKP